MDGYRRRSVFSRRTSEFTSRRLATISGPASGWRSQETGLRKEWPKGGPPLLWTCDKLGLGYSGPAVVGDRLYISCGRGEAEYWSRSI